MSEAHRNRFEIFHLDHFVEHKKMLLNRNVSIEQKELYDLSWPSTVKSRLSRLVVAKKEARSFVFAFLLRM